MTDNTNVHTADNKDAREANLAARKARDEAQTKNLEQMKKDRADQVKANEERMAADAKLRPTPTPDELLSASAGKNIDVKESSGAPLQDTVDVVHTKEERAARAEGKDASYKTRASAPQSTSGQASITKDPHK